ncbi:hypothetical protein [Actinopolymorpha pittospori]|uniref:Uncharacterized protein n=1 Tax=Actinopolymorpha pittospori TaxID=648752 RepID=A0A927R7D5_9ACTN|nr:hypothetical protein [Actinopolymorpha pittospori]MBE1605462.1 hypothetical protein [Actinopolymorpha pittospori]
MTGEGPIELSAIGSDGTRTALTWGPTAHGNVSNFDAPGDEWGAGYRFDSPGCWRLRARRTAGQAEALVFVAPDQRG